MLRELVYLGRTSVNTNMEVHTNRNWDAEWAPSSLLFQGFGHCRYELPVERLSVEAPLGLRIGV